MEKQPLAEFCHEVQIGCYNVTYVKLGQGPIPIFCFPGLLGSMRFSGPELLEKLAKIENGSRYTMYTWDPPGYFLSRPPHRRLTDISFEAEVDLCVKLLKHLGHLSWIILGWSAGGQAAIQLTIKYPHLVSKLIVWGTWDLFDEDHLSVHLGHRNIKSLGHEVLANQMSQHGMTLEEFEQTWHCWVDMIEREHFNQDKVQWVKKFDKINCPTLIIAGSDDVLGPLAQAEHLHAHIKGSRLEVIEGAPHWMQCTHLEIMFDLISNFF